VAVRDDEEGLLGDAGEVALEQELDLAGVRGPDEEAQRQVASPFPGAHR